MSEQDDDLHRALDEMVDEADDESFPASDPPAFTPTHAGAPDHARDRQPKEEEGQ